jgi:hypothetical protein
LEHSVPVSLDPGPADRLRSALDAVRARITAILASWNPPGESS